MKFNSNNLLALALGASSLFALSNAEICNDDETCIKPGKPCTHDEDGCCDGMECTGFHFYKTCQEMPECLAEWHDCSDGIECCGDMVCAANDAGLLECQTEKIGTRSVEIINGNIVDDHDDEEEDDTPTDPPNHKTSNKVSDEIMGACISGDPHIRTFDDLMYDCQGIGEFVLLKSFNTQRAIHGRFKQVSDRAVSVMRGIAIQDEGDTPKVQLHVRETDAAAEPFGEAGCMIQFHVGGDQKLLFPEVTPNGFAYEIEGMVQVSTSNSAITVKYPKSGLEVVVTIRGGDRCALGACTYYPKNDDVIAGLYGTPDNGKADDWMDREGATITTTKARRGAVPHGYCTENWCMRDAAESLFKYNEEGISFDTFQHCDFPEGSMMPEEIDAELTDEEAAICGDDIACKEDMVAVGRKAAIGTRQDFEGKKTKTKRKVKIGGVCDKNRDCETGKCFKNGWAGERCVEKNFQLKSMFPMKEKGGLCNEELVCDEGMTCVFKKDKNKWGRCEKEGKCGKRGAVCETDDDCCGACLESTVKKDGRVIKRCKNVTKKDGKTFLTAGEDCKRNKGPECDENLFCAAMAGEIDEEDGDEDGKAPFKCQELPALWAEKGRNCNPDAGMPGCDESKGFYCRKKDVKGNKKRSASKKKFKYHCHKIPKCTKKAGECKLDNGMQLSCCDENRTCKDNGKGTWKCMRNKDAATKKAAASGDGSNEGSDDTAAADGSDDDAAAAGGTMPGGTWQFLSDMHEAGKSDKVLAAKAYRKLDCASKTVCFKVQAEPTFYISDKENWYKDYNIGNSEIKPTGNGIELIKSGGKTVGWKGCFSVTSAKTTEAQIHANFGTSPGSCGRTASTGKKNSYLKMDFCT